jgi:hypothetical protein
MSQWRRFILWRIRMFETDNEIISFALDTWGNYIETFNVSLSAEDVKKSEPNTPPKGYVEPNFLTSEQRAIVKRVRSLSKLFKGGMG